VPCAKTAPPAPSNKAADKAPWMAAALEELGKNISELNAPKEFENSFYHSLAESAPKSKYHLLDWEKLDRQTAGHVTKAFAPGLMMAGNPEVMKYTASVRTDPSLNPKHKSYELDPVRQDKKGNWRMTAWCAAFVNWCLTKANAPHLGYATAASWIQFGTKLEHPEYGCIVVVKPSDDTGSTTGHVAFYGGSEGHKLWLLGGNQDRTTHSVCWMQIDRSQKRGFRWPANPKHKHAK
jgi:uncharacterized protein (TIGR02594 family)